LLRDVVGLSAEETARALDISVSAANSALFRARATVEEKLGGRAAPRGSGEVDRALLERYVRAFEDANVDRLVALLHEDVQTTMPPYSLWLDGRAANDAFFRQLFETFTPGMLTLLETSSNGQPAFAVYRSAKEGEPKTVHAIQLVDIRGGKVARIDHFMGPEVFPAFHMPQHPPEIEQDGQIFPLPTVTAIGRD
jgi:RNA polymerase sigma-70 factor, ECF subfamily